MATTSQARQHLNHLLTSVPPSQCDDDHFEKILDAAFELGGFPAIMDIWKIACDLDGIDPYTKERIRPRTSREKAKE